MTSISVDKVLFYNFKVIFGKLSPARNQEIYLRSIVSTPHLQEAGDFSPIRKFF